MLSAEQRHYYFGLNGDPLLLARSSTEPFILAEYPPVLVRKNFGNIGSHPIIHKYDDTREQIHKVTHECDVKWVTIDVLRIGYSDLIVRNPVVILVRVAKEAGVLVSNAIRAVNRIKTVLNRQVARIGLHPVQSTHH